MECRGGKNRKELFSFTLYTFLWLIVFSFFITAKPSILNAQQRHQGGGRTAPIDPRDMPIPYHNDNTLVCSDCHTMHHSMKHGFDGGTVGSAPASGGNWLGAGGPNKSLLKLPATQLCLACHDGQTFAPDVVSNDANGIGDKRAAGFFAALETPNYKGHKLSADPGELCSRCHFSGSMATAAVTCTDCHVHHGNGRYRNLQWASVPGGEPMIVALTRPGVSGMQKYSEDNTAYIAPVGSDSTYREVTNICIDCHHSFFAPSYTGNTTPYHRHPGTNTESGFHAPINKTGGNTDPVNWMKGESGGGNGFNVPRLPFIVAGDKDMGFAAATTVASNNEVFCLSCHKGHGSQYAFSLRWDGAGGPGISQACQQCHNK